MKIKFISNCVDAEIPLDELEIVCVPKEKYAEVALCIKSNMNIPFAKIKLFDTDRRVDAEKSFEAATALGNEITSAFNERARKADKRKCSKCGNDATHTLGFNDICDDHAKHARDLGYNPREGFPENSAKERYEKRTR